MILRKYPKGRRYKIRNFTIAMKVNIIRNNKDEPVSVNIGYSDWLAIANKLNINPNGEQITGLDWYAKRESANSILNGLYAYYNCEIMELEDSGSPNPEKLAELEKMETEIFQLLKNPQTFEGIQAMDFIIETYGPVIKAVNLAAKI